MTSDEIRAFMKEQGFILAKPRKFRDADYCHPSEPWITGPFLRAVNANFEAIGHTVYLLEADDCDDFADRAVRLARDLHGATALKTGDAKLLKGCAVGSFDYRPSWGKGQSHQGFVSIVEDRATGKPKLVFLEVTPGNIGTPYRARATQLSLDEKASCEEYSF
jgi:hypothetical protein